MRPTPNASIDWLVDRMHVGTSDEDVTADMVRRMPEDVTPAERRAIIRRALATHHRNQETYRFVTGAIR